MALRLCLHLSRMPLRSSCYFSGGSPLLMEEVTQFNPVLSPIIFLSQNAVQKPPDQKNKRLKNDTYTRITLLESDGNVTVTSLEEAQKLAKRRDLKLVKIVDKQAATQKAVYKMMTASQYFEEELKARKERNEKKKSEIKRDKLLSISDKIDKNDLESKVKMCKKWLEKLHEIRIVINESDESLSEPVFKTIETSVNEHGKIVQKRKKGKEMKFSILPIIKKKEIPEKTDNES